MKEASIEARRRGAAAPAGLSVWPAVKDALRSYAGRFIAGSFACPATGEEILMAIEGVDPLAKSTRGSGNCIGGRHLNRLIHRIRTVVNELPGFVRALQTNPAPFAVEQPKSAGAPA